jgi:hypothetical protein
MSRFLLLAVAVGSLSAWAAFADARPARQPIRPQMTCGDFLRFDDEAKPEVVYWFASKAESRNADVVVDVDATDRLVPTLVERCQAAPAAPLAQQVSAEANRFRKRLQAP